MLYTKDKLKILYKDVSKKIINAIPVIITLIFSFTFADNRYDLDDFEDLDLNTLEKRIEILELDETPTFGIETVVKVGIDGVVECI